MSFPHLSGPILQDGEKEKEEFSKQAQKMEYDAAFLKQRGLITTGFHLPYNPKLIERARKMRKNPTLAEKKLWQAFLRRFPYRVLRQRVIDHFIVDFYIPKLKLVIEVDGGIHDQKDQAEYDKQRKLVAAILLFYPFPLENCCSPR